MTARAVLDPNVLVSGAISSRGAPRELLDLWLDGGYEMIVTRELMHELQSVLLGRKLRSRMSYPDVIRYISYLAEHATVAEQPESGGGNIQNIPDPDDRYLAVLAEKEGAVLVSGDGHLHPEAVSPREFVERVRREK